MLQLDLHVKNSVLLALKVDLTISDSNVSKVSPECPAAISIAPSSATGRSVEFEVSAPLLTP